MRYHLIMSIGCYIESKPSNQPCEGKRFGADGFPGKCEDSPVFELVHANGKSFHICEYHIEFYWNAWPPFRDAVREIWPVRKPRPQ